MKNFSPLIFAVTLASPNASSLEIKTDGLETIVVSALSEEEDIYSQHVDTAEQMPGTGADAAELLTGLAGLQVDSRSNYAQDTRITLRGFGARSAFGVRGVDLLIDGIPLTMPDGQGQFSGAVLDNVAEVKVLSGPLAALYGNAAGGVVALRSEKPKDNKITLGSGMGEGQLRRQEITGEWQKSSFGVRLNANHLEADGNRPHASAQRDQVGLQSYYVFANELQVQWRMDYENAPLLEDPLGLTQAQWQQNPRQLNASLELFNTHKTIRHVQNALSLKRDTGPQRWQLALWQGQRNIEQFLAFKGDAIANSGGIVDLARDFYGANGNYTWDLPFAITPLTMTLGAEYAAMDDRRKGYINNNGTPGDLRRDELDQAQNFDQYLVAQWQPTAKWQWIAGLRQSQIDFVVDDYFVTEGNHNDSGDREFDNMARALSTRYQITPMVSAHISTGKGFETPTLTETAYTNGDTGFNRNLNAAHNQQHELGLAVDRPNTDIAVNLFTIKTRGEITVDQSDNGRTTYHNAAATQRQGVELSSHWRASTFWHTRVATTFLDTEYVEGQWRSNQLPGVAKYHHFLQTNWQPFGDEALQVSLSVQVRGRINTQDNNLIKTPASTTMDFALNGEVDFVSWGGEWWLKVANVTDEKYVGSVIVNQTNGRGFEPAPGRNFAGGIHIRID